MSSTTRRDLESGGANKNINNISYSAAPTSYVYDPEVHWTSWLVPLFVAVNVVVFIVIMYVNDCPKNNVGFEGDCFAKFLVRFSFQPLRENFFFGSSSYT